MIEACGSGQAESFTNGRLNFRWVVFADETGVRTQAPVWRTWGKQGQTPLIALYRRRSQRMNTTGRRGANPADGRVRVANRAYRNLA